ncbi:MAG: helix-turn-helix transcriptional regulator [Oscillospiraceae bacterium]|nr:helix-turn-helix transcriptional regulator [Oscillospiraceae bacterium]MBQ7053672.1 helix-turn-helix transcriptional regulator [Oscillospiraceae bacterium]
MDIHVFFIADHTADNVVAHAHKFFQFMYCKSGKGIITLSGKAYATERGNVYLAAPGVSHSIETIERLELIEFKFYAYGKFADRLKELPAVFSISENPFVTELLFRNVKEGFAKKEFFNSAVDAGMLSFFMNLSGNLLKRIEKHSAPASNYVHLDAEEKQTRDIDIIILKLRDYIEKHFAEKITLDDLANEVHFNKTYFVKRFQVFWGMPPMKYVNNVRLEKVEKLLVSSDDSIKDIAEKTGFSSIHYLSRKFKERYGVAPSEYRTQQKKRSK